MGLRLDWISCAAQVSPLNGVSVLAQTDMYNWNNYYWAANVLLAEVTDGGTFHQQAQSFLANWVCGYNSLVSYTAKGRAWNTNDGTLAETQNAVFLAARYASYVQDSDAKKAAKYLCWARAQVPYFLQVSSTCDTGSCLAAGKISGCVLFFREYG